MLAMLDSTDAVDRTEVEDILWFCDDDNDDNLLEIEEGDDTEDADTRTLVGVVKRFVCEEGARGASEEPPDTDAAAAGVELD